MQPTVDRMGVLHRSATASRGYDRSSSSFLFGFAQPLEPRHRPCASAQGPKVTEMADEKLLRPAGPTSRYQTWKYQVSPEAIATE